MVEKWMADKVKNCFFSVLTIAIVLKMKQEKKNNFGKAFEVIGIDIESKVEQNQWPIRHTKIEMHLINCKTSNHETEITAKPLLSRTRYRKKCHVYLY